MSLCLARKKSSKREFFVPAGMLIGAELLTLSRLGARLVRILESSAHNSPNNGPIEIIPNDKLMYYVLPIHVACLIIKIGPLVA